MLILAMQEVEAYGGKFFLSGLQEPIRSILETSRLDRTFRISQNVDAALAAGGHVTGVIPKMLATKELLHPRATEMHIADSMHARKALMEELADAFVALPGGYGTFEELLEIVTWTQLGLHAKPIGLLNVRGYFDRLTGFFDHAIGEGFIKAKQRSLVVEAATPGELLERLVDHEMPQVKKWITVNEV